MAVALDDQLRAGGAGLVGQRARAGARRPPRRAASRPASPARRRATTRAPGAAPAIARAAASPAGPAADHADVDDLVAWSPVGRRAARRAACPSRPSRAPSSGTGRCRPGCRVIIVWWSIPSGNSQSAAASRSTSALGKAFWRSQASPARAGTMQARRLGRPSMRMRAGGAVPVEAEEAARAVVLGRARRACGCRRRTAPRRPARPRSAGTGRPFEVDGDGEAA